MFKLILICLLFGFLNSTLAAEKKSYSVLQKQIMSCGLELDRLQKIITYNQLYSAIDKQYFLITDKTLEREVLYRSRGDDYKLKVINDKITIYKIGEEGRVSPVSFDAKQKISTVKGKVRQLILNAKVDEDWGQYFEQREQGIQVEYSIRNSKITQMKINLTKTKQILDCQLKNESEVCNCVTSEDAKSPSK